MALYFLCLLAFYICVGLLVLILLSSPRSFLICVIAACALLLFWKALLLSRCFSWLSIWIHRPVAGGACIFLPVATGAAGFFSAPPLKSLPRNVCLAVVIAASVCVLGGVIDPPPSVPVSLL